MDTSAVMELISEVNQGELAGAAAAARAFGEGLGAMFLERDAEVRGLLLATVAGEHVLLLGPPGTAKSALTVAFAEGLGWDYFGRLMGRTTVPEELFGPFSLAGLESDRFERVTAGYLPTAQVAFVDEIFKANSAVLNSLLTILNERIFDQGSRRERVPLEVCVGASNEYPDDDGLGALYDRFLLRYWVEYLRDDDSFEAMLALDGTLPAPTLDRSAVEVLRVAARNVDVSTVIPMVTAIRADLARKHGVRPSDRRWRKALGLVRASAVLDGRTKATGRDLSVLCHCLWDRREQQDPIRAVISDHRCPSLTKANELAKAVREGLAGFSGTLTMEEVGKAAIALKTVTQACDEASKLDKSSDPEVQDVIREMYRAGVQLRARITAAVGSAGSKIRV